jgi:hypothetical protein
MINQQITKCHSCDPISQQVCNDDPRLCGRETENKTAECPYCNGDGWTYTSSGVYDCFVCGNTGRLPILDKNILDGGSNEQNP